MVLMQKSSDEILEILHLHGGLVLMWVYNFRQNNGNLALWPEILPQPTTPGQSTKKNSPPFKMPLKVKIRSCRKTPKLHSQNYRWVWLDSLKSIEILDSKL